MRLFWLLSNNIPRLEADQDRRALRIAVCTAQGAGEAAQGLLQELDKQIGEVVQVLPQDPLHVEMDKEGFEDLRRLSNLGL
jgi:hypothetical protein